MKKPSPLIPQGSLQKPGKPKVRLAVFTVVAIHAVFFVGLLMTSCKRDVEQPQQPETPDQETNQESYLPELDTNYYTSYEDLVGAETNEAEAQSEPTNETNRQPQQQPREPAVTQTPTTPASPDNGNAGQTRMTEYEIQQGDNFYSIARGIEGVTGAAIAEANPDVDPRTLRVGQTIKIPPPSQPKEEAPTADAKNVYVVKKGDTLSKIADKYGTTVQKLKQLNNLRTDRIYAEQKLKIPEDAPGLTRSIED